MSELHVDRREFLSLAIVGGGVLLHPRLLPGTPALRVAVIVPAADVRTRTDAQALDGITLGAEESARTAALFGASVALEPAEASNPGDAAAATERAITNGASVITALGARTVCDTVANTAGSRGRLYLDIGDAVGGSLSGDPPRCVEWTAHVSPDARDRATAVLLALRAEHVHNGGRGAAAAVPWTLVADQPSTATAITALDAELASIANAPPLLEGARVIDPSSLPSVAGSSHFMFAVGGAGSPVVESFIAGLPEACVVADLLGTLQTHAASMRRRVVHANAWLPTLERFGAGQLNDRFRARFAGAEMESAAWCGWFALKAVCESALRARDSDAAAIRRHLLRARFDGHKGSPLSFAQDQRLMQPLYVPGTNPARPFEAPARLRGGSACSATSARRMPAAAMALLFAAVALPLGAQQQQQQQQSQRPAPAAAVAAPVSTGAPSSELLWISNESSRDVSVVRASDLKEIARVPVGERPRGIHASADGRRLYVALSDEYPNQESGRDAIAVIDTRTRRVIARHPAGTDPEQFGLSPDGRRLYAANEDAGTASVTDLATGRVLKTLVVGIEPEGVAVSPDGRWVYITAETSNSVSVLDTRSNTIVANMLVDVRPRAVIFARDGKRAYVTAEIGGTLSAIDVSSHEVVGTVELEQGAGKPVGVAVSKDGQFVYVANGGAHHISVVNAASLQVVGRIAVGRRPWGITLSPDGARLYSANGLSDDVSVIDTRTNRVTGRVSVGTRPWGLAVTP